MNAIEQQDLETRYVTDTPPRCEAKVHAAIGDAPGHHCTHLARWACHNPCLNRTVLWCDGRYSRHQETLDHGWNCAGCHRSIAHWTVVPL